VTSNDASKVSVVIQSGEDGTLGGTKTVTVVDGVATFTDLTLAGTVGETYVLRFSADGLAVADSPAITVTAGEPAQLHLDVQPSETVAGETITPGIRVYVLDSEGNAVKQPGIAVTVNLASGAGALAGTLTRSTDASGTATFDDLSIDRAGEKTIIAHAEGLS